MLNHEETQSLLREDSVTDEVRVHLDDCAECRAYQNKLGNLDALLLRDADVDPSPMFSIRVLAQLQPRPSHRWAWA